MRRHQVAILIATLAAADVHAACRGVFEVAGPGGVGVVARRARRTADGGRCGFDVRVQVSSDDGDACDGTRVAVHGLDRAAAGVAGWRHVSLVQQGRKAARRVLHARVAGDRGRLARLALQCDPAATLAGCENVLAESAYCVLGGGARPRLVGLDSASVCRDEGDAPPAPGLLGRCLAVWHGRVWSCVGGSASGAFAATPLDGGDASVVAGACVAAATDGDAMLILPSAVFENPPADLPRIPRRTRPRRPPDIGPPPIVVDVVPGMPGSVDGALLRSYALPEAIPAGPYTTAFDLRGVPDDSPCAGTRVLAMTALDGVVYAAVCRPDAFGSCAEDGTICVYDTRDGGTRVLPSLQDFHGPVRGLSVLDDGRLVVLTVDGGDVGFVGYGPPEGSGAGGDRLITFDVATGARIDTRPITTGGAMGLACRRPAS